VKEGSTHAQRERERERERRERNEVTRHGTHKHMHTRRFVCRRIEGRWGEDEDGGRMRRMRILYFL